MILHDNFLLASLPADDLQALKPHLELVKLEQQKVLFEAGDEIGLAWFPIDSVISLVVILSTGETIEAAMVGRDGVVGASATLDGKVSLNRAIVQIAGRSFCCDLTNFKEFAVSRPHVVSLLIRHEQSLYAQAQQSAACNAVHSVEARLARWLLRARDLTGTDVLLFTQEFLAEMIGSTRPSVSLVAHTLQQAGVIRYSRGTIQILNSEGLKEIACECYATIRSHYDRLLGRTNAKP
jgi:CRP-like cAMP-binding protein